MPFLPFLSGGETETVTTPPVSSPVNEVGKNRYGFGGLPPFKMPNWKQRTDGVHGNKAEKRAEKWEEGETSCSSPPQDAQPPPSPGASGSCAIATLPEPFPSHLWSEPPGETFQVRSESYLHDRRKESAGPSLLRLLTADIMEVTSSLPEGSVCLHPDGRVQGALRREAQLPPHIFCVNIRIPHPSPGREYHIVTYYAVDDMSLIDGTSSLPNSDLARQFFFGESDKFRDSTFKLLPRVVEGNAIIKKAVGGKPVIMGHKVRQSYVREERFTELIIDVGSDKVANKVVKMCLGYVSSEFSVCLA